MDVAELKRVVEIPLLTFLSSKPMFNIDVIFCKNHKLIVLWKLNRTQPWDLLFFSGQRELQHWLQKREPLQLRRGSLN